MKDFHLLIAGELVSGASVFAVVNPATGQPFAFCPAANATLLDQAVAAAKKALPSWAETDADKRAAYVIALAAAAGIIALVGGLVTINPIWVFGPFTPDQVSAGSQPDWYIGFLDGALRLMPNWETVVFGWTISWNVVVPAVIVPGILFTGLALYPFIEAWVTGDKGEHNLLDRPRNAPTRTAFGMMAITFYCLLWVGGANDIIAISFNLSINAIMWFLRIAIFIIPPIAFVVTRRICLGLQRRDPERPGLQGLGADHGEQQALHPRSCHVRPPPALLEDESCSLHPEVGRGESAP